MLNTAQIYVETVTVTTAGTAVNPSSALVPDGASVIVLAHPSNTGTIKIADTAAKAQQGSGVGNVPRLAEQSASFQVQNPNVLFIDSTVSGERVIITFEY